MHSRLPRLLLVKMPVDPIIAPIGAGYKKAGDH
jgi:hypothetical protein